jgi:hypothetical protein
LLDHVEFPRASPAVDFASASGLFARLMRDQGYNFRAYDRYDTPFFVNYFLVNDIARLQPHLVTAFEVFEHLPEPARSLNEMLGWGARLVVFTTWFADNQNEDWAYYVPENGQHVFFYTEGALRDFAQRRGYELKLCSFFFLFVKRDGFDAKGLAAIDTFVANSEALVRDRVVEIFESIKFGNGYIEADFALAGRLFREDIARRAAASMTSSPAATFRRFWARLLRRTAPD